MFWLSAFSVSSVQQFMYFVEQGSNIINAYEHGNSYLNRKTQYRGIRVEIHCQHPYRPSGQPGRHMDDIFESGGNYYQNKPEYGKRQKQRNIRIYRRMSHDLKCNQCPYVAGKISKCYFMSIFKLVSICAVNACTYKCYRPYRIAEIWTENSPCRRHDRY